MVSRKREILKIREETNEKENRKIIDKINETKNWFFEKIKVMGKSFTRLIRKKRRHKLPISGMRAVTESINIKKKNQRILGTFYH